MVPPPVASITSFALSPTLHFHFPRGMMPSPLIYGYSTTRYTSNVFTARHLLSFRPPISVPVSISNRRFSCKSQSDISDRAHFDFDLFTIGAGSGGVRASRLSANYGASVAVCELPFGTISSDTAGGIGGTCVLRGCIPKKLLMYASKYSHEFEESRGFGWRYKVDPEHDWATMVRNKNSELLRLHGIYKNMLVNAGVTLIEGRGKIVDPHTVDVGGKIYRARNILISVGGRAMIPDIPGSEYAINSDIALDLSSRPKKIAIIGGGYIAVEFAGMFRGFGSEVHVFVRKEKVLRGFDEEIRDFVTEQMSLRGVELHSEETPEAILKAAAPPAFLSLKTNKGRQYGGFSHVMFATGRRPNTENVGAEEVGVKQKESEGGGIEVDEYSRSSVPSIWAIGDATGRMNLTPVALMEGSAVAKTLFGNEPTKPDYRAVPSAVFSQPPIGQVGLTENQAVEEYGDVDVFVSDFRPLKATVSGFRDRTLVKLVVCAKTDKLLGIHMCGEDSPEIVQGFSVAVKAGLTKRVFDTTLAIHPTVAEELLTMTSPARRHRRSL